MLDDMCDHHVSRGLGDEAGDETESSEEERKTCFAMDTTCVRCVVQEPVVAALLSLAEEGAGTEGLSENSCGYLLSHAWTKSWYNCGCASCTPSLSLCGRGELLHTYLEVLWFVREAEVHRGHAREQ